MKALFSLFLDLVFPCSCVSCGELVPSYRNHLCAGCQSLLEEAHNSCQICSGLLYNGRCLICSDRKFYPSRNISLFNYCDVSRAAVHSLKFEGIKGVHRVFIPYICGKIEDFDRKIDIVASVPMNRDKYIKRGYNQSKLLALGVSRKTGIEYAGILKERKNSIQQRSLNYSERFINVIDRYETVNNDKFRNKVILLIDDVFTTGATVNECSRKLILSGASSVFSITVVRSDLKKLENV